MTHLNASCLCGKVKIQLPEKFEFIGNCHCSECRKFSGSVFATAGAVDFDDFKIIEGKESISYYPKTEDTELEFCKHCGSSLFSKKFKIQKYMIRLGILNDALTQQATIHIHVASKAPWYEITDTLTQFEEMPPAK